MALSSLAQLLLVIIVVLAAAKLFAVLLRPLGQPPVIGELIAGIVLGPSLLGLALPDVYAFVFPAPILPVLEGFAQVGVMTFLFVVGLSVELGELRKEYRSALLISQTSVAVPLVLGVLVAFPLFERFAPAGVERATFVSFLGVAMSITAFPVLARILVDRGIERSPLGQLTLACAAVNDATGWCAMTAIIALSKQGGGAAIFSLVATIAFVSFMLVVARPLARRLCDRLEARGLGAGGIAVFLVAMFASGLATEAIGVHALFGAFLFGVVVPAQSRAARELEQSLERFATVLLLPLFFTYSGLRTRIDLLGSSEEIAWTLLIVVVATAGKWLGVAAAARARGMPWRDASAVGVLMNCRGLMELVVLNVGLDLGLISPAIFAMFALMAIVTSAMTAPLFTLVTRRAPWPVSGAERAAAG